MTSPDVKEAKTELTIWTNPLGLEIKYKDPEAVIPAPVKERHGLELIQGYKQGQWKEDAA